MCVCVVLRVLVPAPLTIVIEETLIGEVPQNKISSFFFFFPLPPLFHFMFYIFFFFLSFHPLFQYAKKEIALLLSVTTFFFFFPPVVVVVKALNDGFSYFVITRPPSFSSSADAF